MAFGGLRGTLEVASGSITNPTSAVGSVAGVVAGDLVVCTLSQQIALTVTDVDDNLGNTYTPIWAGVDTGNNTARSFYSVVTNAGTLTSVDATCTASSNDVAFVAAVFEGTFAASPLDAAPAHNTDNTSPYTCPATGTLAQADELVVACSSGQAAAGTAWSATSPNLLAVQIASSTVIRAVIGYQVVSATTSVAPEFTVGVNNTTCIHHTASFKKDVGGATGQPIVKRAGGVTFMHSLGRFTQNVKIWFEGLWPEIGIANG
jgi:hypothetical protein